MSARLKHAENNTMKTGSSIAELLVVLSIAGLALCMFVPTTEETASYTLDIIIGVVAKQ